MKHSKHLRICKLCILTLVISMVFQCILPLSSIINVEAATIKISKKSLTLGIGRSEFLFINGTKKNPIWTTSNITVAKVSQSGQVTGLQAGNAIITATIRKKKYSCNVTVNEHPYIVNAPFEAKVGKAYEFEYAIPKNWTDPEYNKVTHAFYIRPTESLNSKDASSVEFFIDIIDYDIENNVKRDLFTKKMTQEFVTTNFTKDLVDSGIISKDTKISYTDFKSCDLNTDIGNALKIEFNIAYDTMTRSEAIYYYFFDKYCVTLYTDDIEDNITPDAKSIGEYIINTVHITYSY